MSPKKRKNATKAEDIPLAYPPKDEGPSIDIDDIPEEEKERLIRESGLVGHIQKIQRNASEPLPQTDATEPQSLVDEIFLTSTLAVPLCFLYLMMDILIHQQYAQPVTFGEEAKNMATHVPFLAIFIFYTNRYKFHRLTQALFFAISIGCGSRLVFQLNRASWTVVMQQAPPLAVLWVYAVIQLNLLPCVLSLGVVYGICHYLELKLQVR